MAMIKPSVICAMIGVWVRGEMRARGGGRSHVRAATMTRRATEKRPTKRDVVMPRRAVNATIYCINPKSAQNTQNKKVRKRGTHHLMKE